VTHEHETDEPLPGQGRGQLGRRAGGRARGGRAPPRGGCRRRRVRPVAPGVADTPLAAFVVHNDELAPQYLKTIALGRFAQPVDLANGARSPASDEAAHVTAQTMVIDGGQTPVVPGDLEQVAEDTG
jgi:hypothetical protein